MVLGVANSQTRFFRQIFFESSQFLLKSLDIIFQFFFFFFLNNILAACRILDPQPGIEPAPPALEAWSLNHWTAMEVPIPWFLVHTIHWVNFCLLQDFLLSETKLSILFWRQITSIFHPLFWGQMLLYCCSQIAKLCLTLCDPMDCSLPGFSVHGILQARRLEWVAMLSSRGSSRPRDQTCVSCISCFRRQIPYP